MLGASGVTLGTRFLASPEAVVKDGYRKAIIAANDGGVSTGRTKVYDQLRGTTGWPGNYNGRGVLNASFRDSVAGMELEENKKLPGKAILPTTGASLGAASLNLRTSQGSSSNNHVGPYEIYAGVLTNFDFPLK